MINKALFTSYSDEYSTPNNLFHQLDEEFKFSLDPCASIYNHKCPLFFTKADNGLGKDWGFHKVFVNPPYSKVKEWTKKCFEAAEKGALVVALLPVRSDTSYWHEWVMQASEIRLIKGRVRFEGTKNSAPFPSCIVIWDKYKKEYATNSPKIKGNQNEQDLFLK